MNSNINEAEEKFISATRLKEHYSWWGDTEEKRLFDTIVDLQPAADVKKVRRGKWIECETADYAWCCSLCGYGYTDYRLSFCYDCGAEMDF